MIGINSEPGKRHLALQIVAIETCAHCNRACHFCPTNNTVFPPKEFMELSLFNKILEDLDSWHYSGEVSLFGHNEALLDKRLPQLIFSVHCKVPDALQTLSTNGDKLDISLAERLFDCGLDSLLVNCYDNRRDLINRCDEIGRLLYFRYGISYLRPTNIAAYPMVVNRDKRHFILNDARNFGENYEGIDSRAGNVSSFNGIAEPLKLDCPRPLLYTHIKWNGDMILCCQDWKSEVVLGNMKDMTIAEAYNSDLAEHYRNRLAAHDRVGLNLCQTCERGCNEWKP